MEAARIPWRPLGRLLVEQGLLSEDQLEHALEEQESTNRRLGETLIDLGFVSHAALSRALAELSGIERDEPGQTNQATSQHGDAGAPRGHVVYAQLAGRYVLVERGGEPPELDAILELPELGIEKLVVCRIGRSPLPRDE